MSFEIKLKRWAENVVSYCNPIAEEINRAYYVFQSEPRENPRVLLLGLNPGGNKILYRESRSKGDCWKGQCETWSLPNGMTADRLCHQNPWYVGGENYDSKKEWNILKKLKVTISVSEELEKCFENMVYMNLFYFSSVSFSDFRKCVKDSGKNWREIYSACTELTKELIFEIIKPEIIVCLGIGNCFDKFRQDLSVEVESIIPGYLHKCNIDGIDIYGMTHPSAHIGNDIRRQIGIGLSNHICGTQLSSDFIKVQAVISFDSQKVLEYFEKNAEKLLFLKLIRQNSKTLRYCFIREDELWELQITSAETGYIGIRPARINGKYPIASNHQEIFKEILISLGFKNNSHWIGVKYFKDYLCTSVEELVHKMYQDISDFMKARKLCSLL